MRHASRLLAAVSVPLLVAAVVVAYVLRAENGAVQTLPWLLVGIGLALVAASLALMVEAEARLDGLTVPDSHRVAFASAGDRLPAPAWWGPAAAASAVALATGAFLSPILTGLGGGMLLAAAAAGVIHTVALRRHRDATGGGDETVVPLDRNVVRSARRIRAFASLHGGPAGLKAVVEHTGRYGAKIVLVGGDGRLGDLQVASVGRAELACALAGVEPQEWDRELTASVHNTRYEWSKMGSRVLRPLTAEPAAHAPSVAEAGAPA